MINKIFLMMMLGLLSGSSAFAMLSSYELGSNEFKKGLYDLLTHAVACNQRSIVHGHTVLHENGDRTGCMAEIAQLNQEKFELKILLAIVKHQIEGDYLQGIKGRLEQLNFDPRRCDLENDRARIEFNLAATKAQVAANNEINEIVVSEQMLEGVGNDVQAGWAILEKLRVRHPLKVENNQEDEVKDNQQLLDPRKPASDKANNKPNDTTQNSFFANNRTYIIGFTISVAVIGTAYFYGDHIKMWFAGKPVKPKPA